MQRSGGARFFPFFITVIIIILIIVALISVGRMLFGGNSEQTTPKEEPGTSELLNVTANNSVRMTMRGPIVADEEFQSYTITVSPSERELTIYEGYLDEIDKRRTLDNNTRAYEQFVYALDKANMMIGEEPDSEEANDLRGICATGYIYEYSVLVNDEPVETLWTSTCSGSLGTLDASTRQLNNLFFDQIPNSRKSVPFTGTSGPAFSL